MYEFNCDIELMPGYLIWELFYSRWLLTGTSGMAVQEIGIPTGFEADLESIAGVTQIKRTETENRKVVLYFDAVWYYKFTTDLAKGRKLQN